MVLEIVILTYIFSLIKIILTHNKMASIRKQKINGRYYYSLIERVKVNNKWGYKTIESYGTKLPDKSNIKIIKGFAESELKNIPDNSVDLIIIDPPYSINYKTNFRKEEHKTIGSISLDNEKIFETFPEVVRECFRVLKDDSAFYCFVRWDVSYKFMRIIEQYFKVKNELYWVKNNWSMGDLNGSYAMQTEKIIFATKGNHKLNGRRNTDILKFDRVAGKSLLHSHQKPIKILEFLIKKSSKAGDVVLDCYAGSGSTLLSAKRLHRKAVGIELEEKYIQIISDRLKLNKENSK